MTRFLALASAAAIGFVASAANAQVADSVAQAGYRDGRVEAGAQSVGGYGALGALTGFAAGAIGIPLLVLGNGQPRLLGVALTIPAVWTVSAAESSNPTPPPYVAQRLQTRPAAYQESFLRSYAERLAQRRRRAAITGAVAGGVTGLVAFVGLVVYAIASIDY